MVQNVDSSPVFPLRQEGKFIDPRLLTSLSAIASAQEGNLSRSDF